MFERRAVRRAVVVLVLPFVMACAAGSGGGGNSDPVPEGAPTAGDGTVEMVVMNNIFGAETATILLEGDRQSSLGAVPPGETRSFTIDVTPQEYRLVARIASGDRTTRFQLYSNTARVTWNMDQGRITQD